MPAPFREDPSITWANAVASCVWPASLVWMSRDVHMWVRWQTTDTFRGTVAPFTDPVSAKFVVSNRACTSATGAPTAW